MVQADQLCEEEPFFGKNYSKTIVKLVFAICMVVDGSQESQMLIDAVFQSVFASFKTAAVIAQAFRRGLGSLSAEGLKHCITAAERMDEEMMQSSLQFMRTAAACMLIAKAVSNNCLPTGKAWAYEDVTMQLSSTFMPAYQLS